MKFGLSYNTGYYGTDPDQMITLALHAERCGFESFYVPEHIALYPGATVGPVTLPASVPIADPLECLAFVAAATERILLGTGVLLLPYHHPVVLAKRLATLDVLSKGRMRLLTVGVGALPGRRWRPASTSPAAAGVRTRRSTCCGCCGPGTRTASASPGSSSPSPACAASPSRSGRTGCPSTSADPAGPRPAGPGGAATATSPAAGSPRRNGPPSST